MPYIKDSKGYIHKAEGMCADCGRPGKYVTSVVVPGKGWNGSDKPLGVYACAEHRDAR
ncbi:hypothetical protein ACGFYT_29940 [Streptomyces sp. NPDC048208]|uniref:hypothetical protein n=1 Tax=Streptomyces sp. NPDC048208 TaxID=3365515 RepID=UPI00371F91A2